MTIQVAEQTVYLIGHSSTALYDDLEYEDADGRILCLQDFLEAEGCDEETDICIRSDIYGQRGEADNSDLDMIPEFAGRACYGSYGRKQDLNSRYIGHIIQVGHGCYDAETEVLTQFGWKSWEDVTENDKFATRTTDGKLEYHKPNRLIRYQHKGQMYRVEARGVDLLVTPDHKMLVCKTTTKEGRKKANYELIPAKDLGHISHAYIKTAEWEYGKQVKISKERKALLKLLGFAIGDGNIDRGYSLTFHLKKERKIAWLTNVAADADLVIKRNKDKYTINIEEHEWLKNIYTQDREKYISFDLTKISKEECLAIHEGLMEADGHYGRTGDSYDTTSPILADQIQQLALHCGFAANICYTLDSDRRTSSYGNKPLTRLSIIRRELRPEVNKYIDGVGKTYWVENWEGEVFCAEVPNNTLYVRRNGKPVWSGNSVLEHSVVTLAFTGISRSLTHELVRHRLFGYSQRSQRFVDESSFAIAMPPLFQDAGWEEAYNTVIETADTILDAYKRLVEISFSKLSTPKSLVQFAIREGYLALNRIDSKGLAYQVESTVRYAEEWEAMIQEDEKTAKEFEKATSTARRKTAREASRCVLPNCTETKIYMTGNMRAWRGMLDQRASIHADREIRGLAMKVLRTLQTIAPNIFSDYVIKLDSFGIEYAETPNRKV